MTRRLQAIMAGLLALVWTMAFVPVLAQGQPTGQLRVAYFSPDGPNVDVYIDGVRMLSSIVYKTVGTYQTLPVGDHKVDFRTAGADPGTAAIASATATLTPGSYRTVAAAGKAADLSAVVFNDGFTTPMQGKAQVRAIHFAPEVPAVDIAVKGGPIIFSSVGFDAASSYSSVASGSYDLEFRTAGSDQVLLTARGVTLKAGTVESLAGVGGAGRPIEVVQIEDAAAASASGGASTGMGGMAEPELLRSGGLLQTVLAVGLLAALLWVVRRRAA
jgi:hypothetical protein